MNRRRGEETREVGGVGPIDPTEKAITTNVSGSSDRNPRIAGLLSEPNAWYFFSRFYSVCLWGKGLVCEEKKVDPRISEDVKGTVSKHERCGPQQTHNCSEDSLLSPPRAQPCPRVCNSAAASTLTNLYYKPLLNSIQEASH